MKRIKNLIMIVISIVFAILFVIIIRNIDESQQLIKGSLDDKSFKSTAIYFGDYLLELGIKNMDDYTYADMLEDFGAPTSVETKGNVSFTDVFYEQLVFLYYTDELNNNKAESAKPLQVSVITDEYKFCDGQIYVGVYKEVIDKLFENNYKVIHSNEQNRKYDAYRDGYIPIFFFYDENDIVNKIVLSFCRER